MEVFVIDIKKNENKEIILTSKIKTKSKQLSFEQLSDRYINQLVVKLQFVPNEEDFLTLMAIMYIKGSMEIKIRNAVKMSNSPYCSEEDFFSVFYCELQKCVVKYDSSVGNFSNFALKSIDVMYREQRKRGNRSKNPKFNGFIDPEIGIRTMFSVDEKMMNDELKKKIRDLKDGEIVLYKFFGDDYKTKSNKETGEHFNINTDEVKQKINDVFRAFKEQYPTFYEDYFFELGEDNILPEIA